MKIIAALIALSFFAPGYAEARRQQKTELSAKMTEEECAVAIHNYILEHELGLKPLPNKNKMDYYLIDASGEKVGNAYFSSGSCYIYRDPE
jgi:hypothetical protein